MEKKVFGRYDGSEVYIYTLKNAMAELSLTNYGATVVGFKTFGVDIVGGYSSLEDYVADDSNQGGTIGRVANRIEDAEFTMDGAVYMLPDNDFGNCLHGGLGFNKRLWREVEFSKSSLTLSYYSEDGEEGFPSGLTVNVRFTLDNTSLVIEYEAIPDGKTPIALTNHSYFNLDGFGGTVLNHTATIYANRYTAVDSRLIPTGERPLVSSSPFDFRKFRKIGEHFGDGLCGYDHNYILSPELFEEFNGVRIGLGAVFEANGLRLEFLTDQPSAQFYTGNFLGGEPRFKGGVKKIKHGGFCIEAQTEPNCIKNGEAFYDAGEKYTQTTVYRVSRKI